MNPQLRLAKKAALKSNHHHRHATILFKGGAILAIGYNHDGKHSEYNALSKLWPDKRKNIKLFNLRLTFAGNIGIAKPCEACSKLIAEAKIKDVYYTDRDGQIVKLKESR